MSFVIEIVIFVVMFVLTAWYFTVIILPIFYGIPRTIYLSLIKREIGPKAIFMYLITPIIWTIVILILTFLLAYFAPSLVKRLLDSVGFHLGQVIGLLFSFYSVIFDKETRKNLNVDFQEFISPYRRG